MDNESIKLEWQLTPLKESMTWIETFRYMDSLNNEWRLPTKDELKEACDNRIEGFLPRYYWSITTCDENINNAWTVLFPHGKVVAIPKINKVYVRCVREVKRRD